MALRSDVGSRSGGGASRGHGPLDAPSVVEHGSHGGLFATILSGIALAISGLSYYETTLKSADLAVYVPPMIHYARDGDNDVFNIPITISNDGAKAGTVRNMVLEAESLRGDAERRTARDHSAFLGEYPRKDDGENKSFAPISIPGHGTFTETVRFYPMDKPLPFLVDEKGDYRFTLKLVTATAENPDFATRLTQPEVKPLTFELNLPFISFQHLAFRRGTIAMFNKDWKPAVSEGSDSAISRSVSSEPEAAPAAPVPAPAEPEAAPQPPPQPPAGEAEQK